MKDRKPVVLLINDYLEGGGAEQVFNSHREIIEGEYVVRTFIGSKIKLKANALQRLFSIKFFLKILDILKEEHPDIIHIHNFHNYLSPSIIAAIRFFKIINRKKISVVYTSHDYHLICPDSLFGYYKRGKFQRLQKPLSFFEMFRYPLSNRNRLISIYKKINWIFNYKILRIDRGIDVIVSPSSFLFEKLNSYFPQKNILLVRNPVLLDIEDNADNFSHRQSGDLKMIFLGRISIEKGLIEFVDFLFSEKISSFSLSIYGDGPLAAELESKIEQYHFQKNISLLGKIEYSKVDEVLRKHDILLLPSICYENAPLVLVEGALKNLRLLTCNYGGMKEIGDICGDAYYFDYDESGSLMTAMSQMRSDIENAYSDRNLDRVTKMFSQATYLKSIKKLYSSLLN
jgi:glycosyltransferase involved in cell wall biosynthesis